MMIEQGKRGATRIFLLLFILYHNSARLAWSNDTVSNIKSHNQITNACITRSTYLESCLALGLTGMVKLLLLIVGVVGKKIFEWVINT